MKLHLELLLPAILIASAGSEFVAPDPISAVGPATQPCRLDDNLDGTTRIDTEQRILAAGYTEVSVLAKGCDNVWHATAFAEGDPVDILVTPRGAVLTE